MPRDVLQYLSDTFLGLALEPPLFYRWPIGIRFDLGGRATTSAEVDLVLRRATALFEAAFGPADPCVIVEQEWPGDGPNPSLFAFARSNATGLETAQGQVEARDEEEPDAGPHALTWTEQPARSLNYKLIFEAIANADHARIPAISSRVYLINPDSNLIFHMYDDRGLDVIPTTKHALLRLYHDFNAWILDYDRARVDHAFLEQT